MNLDDIAVHLTEVDQRGRSNTRRLDVLDGKLDALHDLTASVKVMAVQMEAQTESLKRMDQRMTALEAAPGKRWSGLLDKLVGGVVAALVAAAMALLLR